MNINNIHISKTSTFQSLPISLIQIHGVFVLTLCCFQTRREWTECGELRRWLRFVFLVLHLPQSFALNTTTIFFSHLSHVRKIHLIPSMGTSISLSPALLHLFFQLPSATILWFQLWLREPASLSSSSPQHPKTKQFRARLLILKNFLELDCLLRMCLGILLRRIFVLCLRNMVRSWMWRYAILVCFSVRTFSLSISVWRFWFIVNWWSVSFFQLSMYNKIRNRGLAFVTMGSPEEALAALNNLESYVSRTMFFLEWFSIFLLCSILSLRLKTIFTLHYEKTFSIEINRVCL